MINIESYNKACIYCILNLENGKLYIGQTRNFNKRFLEHLGSLRRGNHCNIHMQRVFNKGSKLVAFPVEKCNESLLNSRELFWIKYHKTNIRTIGYNMSIGGNFSVNSLTDEAKQRRADARRGNSGSLKGRKQSKEHVQARALANKGQKRNYSPNHILAIKKVMHARKGSIMSGVSVEIVDGAALMEFDSIDRAAHYIGLEPKQLTNKFYKGRAKKLVPTITINNLLIRRTDVI